MKTVSQNTPTIYSATTPENNPPQLVASLVPDEQRISFWPQHFGLIPQWVTLEPRIFGWMDRLCEDYCGGIWNLYTLNNGGAFMAPEPDDDDDETWVLFSAMNGKADRLITERLVQALGLVDIRVPDHLIVGGNQVFSFAEHGLL
ncbi:TPA: restriction endonuclease [Escherichia coli]|nr:restriction endonuclease [Escherichia coli]